MDITLDKQNTTEGKIKITLQADDYQPAVDQKVNEYRKQANLKGFRPGKVPAGVIRKMYGKSILVEEINRLISTNLNNYIRENELNIVGEPLPTEGSQEAIDWDNQTEFSFSYDVGMYSDFDVDLSKVSGVTAYNVEVDDKEVNETLDRVKKQFGSMSNPEVSEAGDDLFGNLKAVEGEYDQSVVLPIDKLAKKDQKQFIGLKEGDTVTFNPVKLYKKEDLAEILDMGGAKIEGMDGDFVFTLKNVNRTELAELNQDLFDKVFGKDAVSSEEEFIEKLKETLNNNWTGEAEGYLRRDLRDAVVEQVDIELPEAFLKRWIQLTNQNPIDDETLEKEFPMYLQELKWNLISAKIQKDNEIKVEHDDVKAKAREMIVSQLGGAGLSSQMAALEASLDEFAENYLQGENGDNYMKVFNEVRGDKVMALVEDKVKTKKKKVTPEKFREAVTN